MKKLLDSLSRHILFILFALFISVDVFLVIQATTSPLTKLGLIFDKNPWLLSGIFFAELFLLFIAFQTLVVSPIRAIKTDIAKFLTGQKDSQSQKIPKAMNSDVEFLQTFFGKSLEILKAFKEEYTSGRMLKSEVQLAADLQKNILKQSSISLTSLDIVGNTKSATEVGGDSYDIITRGDNNYIYLGDVTGHGVASGFVMIMANALISGFSKMVVSGAEILAKTNEILKPRIKSNMLMSLLMVRWNEAEKKFYMTGAGHEYLLIYKKSKGKVFRIQSGGVALGMTRDISKILKESQISFEMGDIAVMYTDGITEARNSNQESGTMFGIDRLMRIIEEAPVKTARGIYNVITVELSKFMGYNHKQFDDITLLTIHYRGTEVIENDVPKDIPKEFITEWNWE